MNHAAIVATYSDLAIAGIIRHLTASGEWRARLQAAKNEQRKRRHK